MNRRIAVLCVAAALALSLCRTEARAASFDCAKATSVEEKAVCADPKLSQLDTLLGRAFSEAKKSAGTDHDDQAKVAAVARVFLKQRQGCGAARPCLVASYAGAIEGYGMSGATTDIPAWIDADAISGGEAPVSKALPTVPGHCVSTKITSVHPRLGDGSPVKPEDYDFGTGIEFDNGGYQVSYDREPALIDSHPGDGAVMCLVAVPQLCPPGDDRGRIYLVTNTRNHRTWALPDSQHMCGGA